MNQNLKQISVFFFSVFYLTLSVQLLGQSWNSKTIAQNDFARTTTGSSILNPLSNDLNSGTLSLKSISYVSDGKAEIIGNNVNYIADKGFEGLAQIVYTACDQNKNCGIASIAIMVVNPNQSVFNDSIYIGTILNKSYDIYLKDISLKLSLSPKQGILQKIADYHYSYTPTSNVSNSDRIIFESNGKKSTFLFSILKSGVQNTLLNDDLIYLNKNTSKLVRVLDNDKIIGGKIANYTQPTVGNIILNADQTFTFTSTIDFEGITQFTYTACDITNNCETATVSLYVSDFLPREDLSTTFRVMEGKSLVIPYEIPISDYEFRIIEQPKYGNLDFYKGQTTINSQCEQQNIQNPLVYTPLPGFIGTDHFVVNFCLTTGTKQCAPLRLSVEAYAEPTCISTKDYVWPGDANNDGLVDLKDFNIISHLLGTSGVQRSSFSSNWTNQKSEDWNRALNINAKYADANGDGMINESDLTVIYDNFKKSHKLLPQGIFQLLPSGMKVSPVANVIAPGEDAVLQFSLGTNEQILRDIESISFDLEFNDQVINAEDLEISILENSWFGYNNVVVPGRNDAQNKISVNFVSALNKPRNGQGPTVKVKAKGGPITGHIEGFKIPKEFPLEFKIKNLQLGQSNGNTLGFADATAKVIVDFSKKTKSLDIKAFPNPATNYISLSGVEDELIESLEIFDITGKTLLKRNLYPTKLYKQDVSQFQSGLYFLKIKSNKGLYTDKVEIIK